MELSAKQYLRKELHDAEKSVTKITGVKHPFTSSNLPSKAVLQASHISGMQSLSNITLDTKTGFQVGYFNYNAETSIYH